MEPILWQTAEEAEFVKLYMLLPIMLDVLERDKAVVGSAGFKMPEVYNAVTSRLQDTVTAELAQVRKSMREHGMKVYEQRRTTTGIEARYLCRGYHYEFSMLWGRIKAEILQRFCVYLGVDITEKGAGS